MPAAADITTIYIVRHAEREDHSGNSPISAEGQSRAKELVHVLKDEAIDAVFVTEFLRTQQTGAPLAAAVGVAAQQYSADDARGVVDTVLANHRGGRVLVVGHSDTADDIVAALGVTGLADLGEDSFDRLFVVHVLADGAHLAKLRYGAETP